MSHSDETKSANNDPQEGKPPHEPVTQQELPQVYTSNDEISPLRAAMQRSRAVAGTFGMRVVAGTLQGFAKGVGTKIGETGADNDDHFRDFLDMF
jgi:hypothetical protein